MFRGIVSVLLVVLVVITLVSFSQKPEAVKGVISRLVEKPSDETATSAVEKDGARAQMVHDFIEELHQDTSPNKVSDKKVLKITDETIDQAIETLNEEAEKVAVSKNKALSFDAESGEWIEELGMRRDENGVITNLDAKKADGLKNKSKRKKQRKAKKDAIAKSKEAANNAPQDSDAENVELAAALEEQSTEVVDSTNEVALAENVVEENLVEQGQTIEKSAPETVDAMPVDGTEAKAEENIVIAELDAGAENIQEAEVEVKIAKIDQDTAGTVAEESQKTAEVQETAVEAKSDVEQSTATEGSTRAMMKAEAFNTRAISPAMKKKIEIIRSIKTAPSHTLAAAASTIETEKAQIFFGFNDSSLTQSAQDVLASLAVQLLNDETVNLRIVGNTDALGSAAVNKALSKRRAAVVASTLRSLGVDESRIKSSALAFNKPLKSNDDWQGRQKNRRVDIFID